MRPLTVGVVVGLALCVNACDSKEKPPTSAPLERSQIVEAKPSDAAQPTAAQVVPVASTRSPKAPRVLCSGQEHATGIGRAAPKKSVSQSAASGELALPENLSFGGGFVWVNFWAAWCAPCKEEIPRLLHFQRVLAGSAPGFRLHFVSLDDDERQLNAFLAGQPPGGLRRSYWLKEGREREEWLKSAGLEADEALPFHLLFDPKGKLRCVVKGAVEDQDLATLKGLVAP